MPPRREKSMTSDSKTSYSGFPGALSRSMNSQDPGSSKIHRRYASVMVENPTNVSSGSPYFYEEPSCQEADIWFGSYHATGENRIWTTTIKHRRSENYWEIVLASAGAAEVRFNITKKDVNDMQICARFSALMIAIMPTKEFAALVTTRLSLDGEKNEVFNPSVCVKAGKRLLIGLSGIPQDQKRTFHGLLTKLQTEFSNTVSTLEEVDTTEYVASHQVAMAEIAERRRSAERRPTVERQETSDSVRKDQRFDARVVALGVFSLENCTVILNPDQGELDIFNKTTKKGIRISRSDIERCDFAQQHLLAVFELSPECRLMDKLRRPNSGFTQDDSRYAKTKLSMAGRQLRVLFSKLSSLNLQDYLAAFNLSRGALSPDFAYRTFPECKAFKDVEKSLDESRHGNTFFHKNSSTSARSNSSLFSYADVLENAKLNVSNSANGTLVQDRASKGGLTQLPAKRLPPPGLKVNQQCKKTKHELVNLDGGPEKMQDAVVPRVNKPIMKISAPKAHDRLFPRMPSVFEVAEAKAAARRAREATQVAALVPASSKVKPPGGANSSDYIVLEDSSDEEDKIQKSKGFSPLVSPVSRHLDLPEGCHDIFYAIHNFPEVILGNASVMAGDVYHLAKGQQLGDGIVQFMLEFLRLSLHDEDTRQIHFLSYFFFQTFLGASRGLDLSKADSAIPEPVFARLRDHTKKAKIFNFEFLVVPILNDQHWYIVIICHPKPSVESAEGNPGKKTVMVVIDSLHSLGSKERHKFTCDMLAKWLECEYFYKFGETQSYNDKVCKRVEAKTPQQANGVDCGVFMFNALAYFIREKHLFAELGQKGHRLSIPRPALEKWFAHDEIAIEKSRLMMLHCYYIVAAINWQTVYRDDYIPMLIEEVGDKTRPDSHLPGDAITIESSSPLKPHKPERHLSEELLRGTLEGLSAMTTCDLNAPKSDSLDLPKIPNPPENPPTKSSPVGRLPLPLYRPPHNLSLAELEYYTLCGYQLPAQFGPQRGEFPKMTGSEKMKMYRAAQSGGKLAGDQLWEPHFVPGRTAVTMWEEFMAWRGDRKETRNGAEALKGRASDDLTAATERSPGLQAIPPRPEDAHTKLSLESSSDIDMD